jgi:hypothetical protein
MTVIDYTRPPADRHHSEKLPDFATDMRDTLAVSALSFFDAINQGILFRQVTGFHPSAANYGGRV